MHLNLLVSEILELKDKELRDPMDKKQVMGFIKSINDALGINGQEVKDGERPLTRYYLEDCCEDEEDPHTPFSRLPENYLDWVHSSYAASISTQMPSWECCHYA